MEPTEKEELAAPAREGYEAMVGVDPMYAHGREAYLTEEEVASMKAAGNRTTAEEHRKRSREYVERDTAAAGYADHTKASKEAAAEEAAAEEKPVDESPATEEPSPAPKSEDTTLKTVTL